MYTQATWTGKELKDAGATLAWCVLSVVVVLLIVGVCTTLALGFAKFALWAWSW